MLIAWSTKVADAEYENAELRNDHDELIRALRNAGVHTSKSIRRRYYVRVREKPKPERLELTD
jgi:hypothetical protein